MGAYGVNPSPSFDEVVLNSIPKALECIGSFENVNNKCLFAKNSIEQHEWHAEVECLVTQMERWI